jgi:hypothetical protein
MLAIYQQREIEIWERVLKKKKKKKLVKKLKTPTLKGEILKGYMTKAINIFCNI